MSVNDAVPFLPEDAPGASKVKAFVTETQLVIVLDADVGDDTKQYISKNMHPLFDAANTIIASAERVSEVKSLTDPTHFNLRKQPIENVHSFLLSAWDTLKTDNKGFYVFISSLKHGVKTVKRQREDQENEDPAKESVAAPEDIDGAPSGDLANKKSRKKARKPTASGPEQAVERAMARCAPAIERMCSTVEKLRRELEQACEDLKSARAPGTSPCDQVAETVQ